MKKRVLSIIMALIVIFTSVPLEPILADSGVESGTFTISSEGIVSAYSDAAATQIIVPEMINSIAVKEIAAGAFDGSKYTNLKSVAVFGSDVIIGEEAFGYISGSRVDEFQVWGKTGSTAETYSNQGAFEFGILAESLTNLESSQADLTECFAGGNAIYIKTQISALGSKDIIWSSEDSELVSIVPYTMVENSDGTWEATAQVKVLKTSDTKETCKIYATTRSGISKDLELTLKKPASEVTLIADIYEYDIDLKQYKKVTPPSSYMDGKNIYVDKGYFVDIQTDCGEDNDDSSGYSIEIGNTVIETVIGTTTDGSKIELFEVKKAGNVKLTAFTKSGQVSKEYNLITYLPATELAIKLNGAIITNGLQVVQGYSGKLSATFTPSNSTDEVIWSSNNSIAQISFDGTLTANGYGNAVITCKVKDAKSMNRILEKEFTLYINQKYQYSKMEFIDNMTDKNIITSSNIAANTTQQLCIFDPDCTDESKQPNEPISWTSSDTSIATIDQNGLLTTKANKNGKIKITAKAESGIIQTIDIFVYVEATKITPDATSYQIPEGQILEVPYVMTPSNTGETVTWISDDSSSVKVLGVESDPNVSGKYILKLQILKTTSGFIDINGRSSDSNVSSQIQVKGLTAVHVQNISMVPENYVRSEIDGNGDTIYSVEKGSNFTITANINPLDYNDILTWEYTIIESPSSLNVLGMTVEGNLATINPNFVGTVVVRCISSNGVIGICKFKIIVSATSIDILNSKGASLDVLRINVDTDSQLKAKLSSGSTDNISWSVISGDASNVEFSKIKTTTLEITNVRVSKTGTYVIRAVTDSGKVDDITIYAVIETSSLDFIHNGEKIDSLNICPDQKKTISLANILPENTSDSKYNWEETKGNLSIKVAEDGKSAEITGISVGNTSIKVSGESGKSFTLDVTVILPAKTLQINSQDVPEDIIINKGGALLSLYANLTPSNTNDRVTWTVSREGIISLKQIAPIYGQKQQIQIQGLEVGTVVITATTESGLMNSISVEVKTIDIANCVAVVPTSIYTGNAIEVVPLSVKLGTTTLKKDTDYIILGYDKNTQSGEAIIHLQGIGKYSGNKDVTFKINPKALSVNLVTITYSNSYTYTKDKINPPVKIQYGSQTLKLNTDYKVKYLANSINVGSYTFEIVFMGNFSGTIIKTYKIVSKSATSFTVKNTSGKTISSMPSKSYTTQAITQSFLVYDGNNKLVEGTDYTVKYSNNINAGKATVLIYGKGNYSTSTFKSMNFIIKPYSLANVKITSITDKVYSGSAIKPSLIVKRRMANGKYQSMRLGQDYKVTYSNNIKTGRATAKIVAGTNGNYTSSRSINYRILPKQVTGLKQTSASQSSVKLSWTKSEGSVSGYAIYSYNAKNKKYTYQKTVTSGTSTVISGRKAGTSYVYAVRAFTKVGNSTKYYSSYSSSVTAKTVSKAPSISSITTSNNSVTVKWNPSTAANRYYIYYSTNGGKTYKRAGSSTNSSYLIRSLTKGKNVTVRIKSASTIAGKEYLSSYSSKKTIKVR